MKEKKELLKNIRNYVLEILFGVVLIIITYVFTFNIFITIVVGVLFIGFNIFGFLYKNVLIKITDKLSKFNILFSLLFCFTFFLLVVLFLQNSVVTPNEELIKLFSIVLIGLALLFIYVSGALVISLKNNIFSVISRVIFGVSAILIATMCCFYILMVKNLDISMDIITTGKINYPLYLSFGLFAVAIEGLTHFNKNKDEKNNTTQGV
jgi:hypothetical protein